MRSEKITVIFLSEQELNRLEADIGPKRYFGILREESEKIKSLKRLQYCV